jgi:transcriptional regulator with XRE-family HTH domain
MPVRESAAARGARRGRLLRLRLGEGLADARKAAGLSLREVARLVGVGHEVIARLERGDARSLTIDLVARTAAVLGHELASSLYPNGDPVRDRGHLALLDRFRARLPPTTSWRAEVPMPITGDLRSGDAVISLASGDLLVEAETRIDDIQAVERKAAAKARDLGATRTILVLADTRHHRRMLRDHRELLERFPVGTRACITALGRGEDPGGDCLVIL